MKERGFDHSRATLLLGLFFWSAGRLETLFGRASCGLFLLAGMDETYFRSHYAGSFALAQFFNFKREIALFADG